MCVCFGVHTSVHLVHRTFLISHASGFSLHELKPKDISGPGRDPDEMKITNSRYQPSWIWLAQRVNPLNCSELKIGEDPFKESMQVEWAKARARMMRWKEELLLVQEEM